MSAKQLVTHGFFNTYFNCQKRLHYFNILLKQKSNFEVIPTFSVSHYRVKE